jgi:hypothetical protein
MLNGCEWHGAEEQGMGEVEGELVQIKKLKICKSLPYWWKLYTDKNKFLAI